MKQLLSSSLAAGVLAASFALPLHAAPIFVPKAEQVQSGDIEQVRHHRRWYADRYWNHRYAYRSCGYYGRCYYRYPGYYRYRYPGYYGYRYPGYYGYRYPYYRGSGVTIYFEF